MLHNFVQEENKITYARCIISFFLIHFYLYKTDISIISKLIFFNMCGWYHLL